MRRITTCFTTALLILSSAAFAVDEAGSRYISQLANGGPSSIRSAAESMYHTGFDDREVLDVAAEVLLTNYEKRANSGSYMDALAWVCKALGQSADNRYYATLDQVSSNTGHRSLKKHCTKAARSLSDDTDAPYRPGGVNLATYAESAEPAKPQAELLSDTGKKTLAAGKHPFSILAAGMSMEEITDLVGQPSNVTGRVTGKAFIPFYQGGDSSQMIALYKGLGRIVYNRTNAYSQTWRAAEIIEDPQESGYP